MPPGLVNQQMQYLQTAVEGFAIRLQSAESKEETFEAAIKDAQAKIDQLISSLGSGDPWAASAAARTFAAGAGAPAFTAAPTASVPERFDLDGGVGRPRFPDLKWKLYDEKYFFQPSSLFTGKDASGWLLGLRDYLSGRTAELDRLFDHIEKQSDEMSNDLGWMLQCASNEEVSKQLWALLAALLKDHSESMRRFRNVPRHNGFQAWQTMTAPINEDKAEVRKDLLKLVSIPAPANSVDNLEKALEEWKTTKRLFVEADGALPSAEIMKLAFAAMLPHEVYTYVSLHLDTDEYSTLPKLEKFVLKYAKLLLARKRPRPAHVVEQESQEASSHLADEPGRQGETHEDEYDPEFIQQVASVLNLDAFDPAGRADLLAFMRGRFNPRAAGPPRA